MQTVSESSQVKPDKVLTKVYFYRNLMYVPHRDALGMYVGPGFGKHIIRMWSEMDLIKAGAHESLHYLYRYEPVI